MKLETASHVSRYSYNELASNVTVSETHSCELGQTGISSFRDSPVKAAEWLATSQCVLGSVARIPAQDRPWSRIELCSTAGMRVIRLSQPEVATQILANLTQQLTMVGGGMTAGAMILSGHEEAVRGWMTAWQLSDNLVGALDWGGASAQITVPEHHDSMDGDQVSGDNVRGQSNLCYGQQEALNRHRAALVYAQYRHGHMDLDSDQLHNVSDSCLPSSAVTAAVPISQLFSSPCTKLLNSSFMSSLPTSNVTVSFVSDYNYNRCSRLIQSQFRPSTCMVTWQPMKGELTCLDPDNIAPPQQNLTYLAMSTYYYISHHLNLSQPFSMDQFLHTTRDICSLVASHPRLQLLKKVKADTSACFQSLLMYHLLTSGYHFNESSWDQLQFVKRISGAEVGWGLGHAIIHANSLLGQQYIRYGCIISEEYSELIKFQFTMHHIMLAFHVQC